MKVRERAGSDGAHLMQLITVNPGSCTGCKTCELVCSLSHCGECNPERAAIRVVRRERRGLLFALPLVCQHCQPAPCVDACPTGALHQDPCQGILVADHGMCTACGECSMACPVGGIRVDSEKQMVFACDLCNGDPQCVAFCHARCLTLVSGEEPGGTHHLNRLAQMLSSETFAAAPGPGR